MNKKFAFGLSLAAAAAFFISGCASDSSKGSSSTSDALPTPATTPPGAPAPASVARASAPAPAPAIKEEIHNPSAPAAVPATAPVATEKYTVKSGDSLWKIARERKTSVAKLKELNHLTGDSIRAGDELEVPVLK